MMPAPPAVAASPAEPDEPQAPAEPVQPVQPDPPAASGQVIADQGISPVELMVDGYDKNGVWWEKDREVEGLWWHYTPGESWGRWRDQTASCPVNSFGFFLMISL